MNIILETTKTTARIGVGHFSAEKQNFLEMYHKLGNFDRNLAQKNDRIVIHASTYHDTFITWDIYTLFFQLRVLMKTHCDFDISRSDIQSLITQLLSRS